MPATFPRATFVAPAFPIGARVECYDGHAGVIVEQWRTSTPLYGVRTAAGRVRDYSGRELRYPRYRGPAGSVPAPVDMLEVSPVPFPFPNVGPSRATLEHAAGLLPVDHPDLWPAAALVKRAARKAGA